MLDHTRTRITCKRPIVSNKLAFEREEHEEHHPILDVGQLLEPV
jgi:hypothetical protein